MTPERWKKVEELFQSAFERPPHERSAFLDAACSGDHALRSQIETLLLSLNRAETFVETPAFGSPLYDTQVDRDVSVIGKRLGSYRIEREIGRGGMGSVYLAIRADDEFRQRVAIKLIKRGMDTDFIVRRFRNERQILANLDHPHIARLLDGGSTEDGLPYFVMEYVEGQPIYQYCDDHNLSLSDRLKLFRKVCSAVHYAHQNLVIHRDLKPGNVLVTAEGIPKLLDFGIAKILNPEMVSHPLDPTTAAVRLMTPEYASPEQIRGDTVTVASDVYSLGVMLFELLTDHRPYRLGKHRPQELARLICEEEPELPSVAVNLIEVITLAGHEPIEITPETVSKARSTTPEQLKRELAGNVDNIVLKALRKDTEKRYASVEGLSDDIRRHLEGLPVSAPSYFYSAVTAEIDTADPATGGRSIAVLPFQMLRVEEKGDEFLGMGMADAIITKISNIHRIMVRPTSAVIKYFDGTHNTLAAGHELNVGYVLDGRIQRAVDRVRVTVQLVRVRDGVPLWAAKFDENFTDIFTVEDSISEQVAQALVPRLTGEERELLLRRETENAAAYQAYLKGRYFWNKFTNEDFDRALAQFREAIRLDPDYAQAYVGLADYYTWAAIYGIGAPNVYFPEAKKAAIKALELDESLAEAHAALAFTNLCYDWDWEGAEQRFKRAIELNTNYAPAHQWYSNLLAAQGRFNEAIWEIKRAQDINPLSLMDISIGGWTYYHARQYEAAVQQVSRALEIDPKFGNGYLVLGTIYERLGRYDEAIQFINKALELSIGSVMPLWLLGYTLGKSGKREQARAVIEKLTKLSAETYVSPYYFALVYAGLGDHEDAFQWLEKAYESRDEWLIWLGTEPKLDELRSDPRFDSLLERVGLAGSKSATAGLPVHETLSGGTIARAEPRAAAAPISSTRKQVSTRTEEIKPTPTLAEAVYAVYRDHKRERARILGVAASIVLLAAAFIGYRFVKRPAAHFQTVKLEKLTTTGNVTNAAISPDGKYVGYVMDEAGKQGLWVRQISVANSIRIIPPADSEYRGLTFSKEGAYIYYVSSEKNTAGNLYRVPVLGGSSSLIKKAVDSPITFAPNGKQFAFIRRNPDQGQELLMVTDDQGAKEEPLASRKFPEHFSLSSAPAWSPDGKSIVCITQTSDANGFYMKLTELQVANHIERPLTVKRWLEIGQTGWLSDGTGLILSAHDELTPFTHLWLLSYPGGEARKLTSDLSDYRTVSLPAMGDSLLSIQRQTFTSIWIAPKDDQAHPAQVTSGAGRFFDLSWTSDGKIIYAADTSGNADIWEMEANGTGQKQLTAGVGRNYAPVPSPDGRYIVFHSNRSGSWQIWRMARDGSDAIQLTEGNEESNWPDVSPDGRWVIYQHIDSGTPTLWKIPIDGGTPARLTSSLSMRPSISLDGNLVAYWQKDQTPNAPWRIAIASSEGAQVKLIDVPQSSANSNGGLNWTPDGRAVMYIDLQNGVANLMSQTLDNSSPRRLTNFTKEQFYSFDLSRDGRLVFSRGVRTTDAVLMSDAR